MEFTPQDRLFIQENLLNWFERNQRPLPWRRYYEAYEIWISEIMLQQTQVATMLPYFKRWMQRFPNLKSLAEADEETVLKSWEGLGYYSRARNIHKTAQSILATRGDAFPTDHAALLKLPGIGPYTAAAICSIAFEQDYAVLDGNVIRVLSRLLDFREKVQDNKALLWETAQALLPPGKARDFNQAMMELGALVCTPRKPACTHCPLQKICKANTSGTQELLPYKGPSRSKVEVKVVVAIIHRGGTIFIQKRQAKGLMAGLWEFPGGKVEKNEEMEAALHREIQEELAISIKNIRPFMNFKHAYTKYLVDLHCYLADFDQGEIELKAASDGKWVSLKELDQFTFPAANVKLIEALYL